MPSISRAFGGPTEAMLGYAAAGVEAGISTSIAAPAASADDTASFRARLDPAVELLTFATVGPGPLALSPAMLGEIRSRRLAWDVAHVHGLFNLVSTLGARTARRVRLPLVLRPFGTLSRFTMTHRRSLAKRVYFELLERRNVAGAGAVHFTSEAERDEAAWHGVPLAGRGYVIPPPSLLDERPLPRTGPRGDRVLFLSRLHPKKGIELLLDAWPAVVAVRPGATLTIAGDGEPAYAGQLRARVMQSSGAPGEVAFPGFVHGPDKAALLATAGVFVLPSQHENFGVAVVEAIAAGVPVVVSEGVQLAPWVREHGLGYVVDRTPHALASAIVRALGDDVLRARCEAHGAELVARSFSARSVGAMLRAMYEDVVSRARI